MSQAEDTDGYRREHVPKVFICALSAQELDCRALDNEHWARRADKVVGKYGKP